MGRELVGDRLVAEAFVESGRGNRVGTKPKSGIALGCACLEMRDEDAANTVASRIGSYVDVAEAADARVVDVGISCNSADGDNTLLDRCGAKKLTVGVKLSAARQDVFDEASEEAESFGLAERGEVAKCGDIRTCERTHDHWRLVSPTTIQLHDREGHVPRRAIRKSSKGERNCTWVTR